MESPFLSIIGQAITVALIVAATRWLYKAKGSEQPRSHGSVNIYGIKWRLRVFSYVGTGFFTLLFLADLRHDWTSPSRWPFLLLFLTFAAMALWCGSGLVRTDPHGIKKTVLWHSRFIRWSDVTEVRLREKKGGAIEIRTGSEKLIIDSRFDGLKHLLSEVADRTKLAGR